MQYSFKNQYGERRLVSCPMTDISEMTEDLGRLGWTRVFDLPNIVTVPGFQEAYVESVALADDPYQGGQPSREVLEASDFRQFTPQELAEGFNA